MIITIDGPTASGKSTVGRLLAKNLNYYYLYTGLLYRAVAYLLIKDHNYTVKTIANPDLALVDQLLQPERFTYYYDPQDRECIIYDGVDITPHLKNNAVSQGASIVSTNPEVRERLNRIQREIANDHDVVIDGRDAGSVVFPHAEYTFFLTASEDERAARWQKQQEKLGETISLEQAKEFITIRDQRDFTRKSAPLTIPVGAHVIDNSDMTIQETLHEIKKHIYKKGLS